MARERDYRDEPGWVPDPARDRRMEIDNPSWCVQHDSWKIECGC